MIIPGPSRNLVALPPPSSTLRLLNFLPFSMSAPQLGKRKRPDAPLKNAPTVLYKNATEFRSALAGGEPEAVKEGQSTHLVLASSFDCYHFFCL